MSVAPEPKTHRPAIRLFMAAILVGVGGGGAMILWIFANAMSHSGFGLWPLWYAGCTGFLLAVPLFIASARSARRWARRRIAFEASGYVLALVCGVMGLWGIATGMSTQRPRYDVSSSSTAHQARTTPVARRVASLQTQAPNVRASQSQ